MKKQIKLYLSLVLVGLVIGGIYFFSNNHLAVKKQAHPPEETLSGMAAAMDFWYANRAYPSTEIPFGAYANAFDYKQRHSTVDSRTDEDKWEALGPKNFGGRTLCMAFNSQNSSTIYVGSASGGLWRSYSGGVGAEAWEQVKTGLPILGVPAIAIHPTDSNTMFIGTGEVYNYQRAGTGNVVWRTRGTYGMGILKTTDGGLTWQKSLDWANTDMRGINMIKFLPGDPNTLFAATTEGVYKSTDMGGVWSKILDAKLVSDIIIHPTNTDTLLAAAGNLQSPDRGVYRSIDGGQNWTQISTFPDFFGKVMLAYAPSQPDRVYASVGYISGPNTELMISADFGMTWFPRGDRTYTYGWFAHDVAVNPNNPDDLVCAGQNVYRYNPVNDQLVTKAFWYNWSLEATPVGGPEGPPDYVHADVHDIQYHPTNPSRIYFVTDGGMFKSEDGGETFTGINGGMQTTQFYPGTSNSYQDSSFFIGGLQDNATTIYEGNDAWRRVIGGDGSFTAVHPTNDQTIYASIYWLRIYKSWDRANNFDQILRGRSYQSANFIAPFAMCITNPNVIYAGADTIFKTTTGDAPFTPISVGYFDEGRNALSIAISPSNCDKLYVSTSPITQGSLGEVIETPPARIRKSIDGGATWQTISTSLPDRMTMEMAIDPMDDEIVYAVMSGYGSSHVYKTIDGGANWMDKGAGLPDVPFNTVVIDPTYTNHVYVGGDLGVYVSTDGGDTWEDFTGDLIDGTLVMDLTISTVNRKLRMATHGKGLYQRDLLDQQPNVGIENELIRSLNLGIYPNPGKDQLSISFELKKSTSMAISLKTLNGKEIKTLSNQKNFPIGENQLSYSMETLSAGVYLVHFQVDGRSFARKWIKEE